MSPALLQKYFAEPEIGRTATLSEEYTESALTDFERTGLSLAFAAWCKLYPGERVAAGALLLDVLYQLVLSRRWEVVRALGMWGAEGEHFNSADRLVCRMNAWQAQKRLGEWDDVKDEIEALDTSALHARFAAVRAALLEDMETFWAVVEESDGAGLGPDAWEEWPIFEWIRDDPKFKDLRERFGTAQREGGTEDDDEGSAGSDVRNGA